MNNISGSRFAASTIRLSPFFLVDPAGIDDGFPRGRYADLPLGDVEWHRAFQATRLEPVMDADQLFRRNAQRQIFRPRIVGVADIDQEPPVADQAIEEILQRRNLVGPGAVMVERHALAERHRQPGDPQIAGIDQIGLAEFRAEQHRQAAPEMPPCRRFQRRVGRHHRHAGQRLGRRRACLVGHGHMQPRSGEPGRQIAGGGDENLGIRLGAWQRILEGEQNFHE